MKANDGHDNAEALRGQGANPIQASSCEEAGWPLVISKTVKN